MNAIKKIFCKHDFLPITKESFTRIKSRWDKDSKSWVTTEEKIDGYIEVSQCNCGKFHYDSFHV